MSKFFHIVDIELDAPLYLTDTQTDFEYSGNTYSSGYLSISQKIKSDLEASFKDFDIELSAADGLIQQAIDTGNHLNARVVIRKVRLNADNTVNSVAVINDGNIDTISKSSDGYEPILTITINNVLSSFNDNKEIALAEVWSESIFDEVVYWGVENPNSTNNDSPFFGGGDR